MPEKLTLFKHQQKALQLMEGHNAFALFAEPGTGKTLTALEQVAKWGRRALVVAPLSTLESVWVEEIHKWKPRWKVFNWHKNRNKVKKLGVVPHDDFNHHVGVVNYESFPIVESTHFIKERYDTIILDESTKIKNHTAKITKTLLRVGRELRHRLILSGTPAPNNPLEFWSQMAFVDDTLLGDNFYRFRNIYASKYGSLSWQYSVSKRSRERIMEKIKPKAFFVRKDDCLDLPPATHEKRYVDMEEGQKAKYVTLLKENIAQFQGRTVLGSNELAKVMKLRQITSGFVIDVEGKALEVSEEKLKALRAVLEELEGKQVIIWCQFKEEIRRIKQELGPSAVTLYGDTKAKDREENIRRFRDGNVPYLVAHPRSAGHGLNLANCSYAVYYSLSYSYEEMQQSQDRINRAGQKNKMTYYYLICPGTIDEVLYKVLTRKESLSDGMLEMLRQ